MANRKIYRRSHFALAFTVSETIKFENVDLDKQNVGQGNGI